MTGHLVLKNAKVRIGQLDFDVASFAGTYDVDGGPERGGWTEIVKSDAFRDMSVSFDLDYTRPPRPSADQIRQIARLFDVPPHLLAPMPAIRRKHRRSNARKRF